MMMADSARDPYERMLGDALVSLERAHDAINGVVLSINTGESERAVLFRHIDEMRRRIEKLEKLAHGDGNGSKGYGQRLSTLEDDRITKQELAKMRWWSIGTIIAALGTVAAHFVR